MDGQLRDHIRPFAVCSDVRVERKVAYDGDLSTIDLTEPATTDATTLAQRMAQGRRATPRMTVVFATYQSIEVVHNRDAPGLRRRGPPQGRGRHCCARENLVRTWEDGRPILPDNITKSFGKVQAAANVTAAREHVEAELGGPAPALPRLVVHELRQPHATILLKMGVPVHIVAKRLGHKDPSVTLNVCTDVIPDDDTSAVVDVFRAAVWGA